ncbi:MAG TPA: glycosyltransferase family 9 protein [Steroidobacteraceae bacterium]|nr:glycosyltransferase family 9 protein [Steroidobacteraceae bacterium]
MRGDTADEREAPAAARGPSPARPPLAVRLCNWVGEVVLAVPTLRRLEAAGYELRLLGKGWAPALLEGAHWPVVVRAHGLLAATRQLAELRRGLAERTAAGRRPAALLLTKSFSSALEARLGGWDAVGYARDGRSFLLAQSYALPRFAHASHAYWHLASRFLGSDAPYPTAVTLTPSAAQAARAAALLESHGLAARPYLVLCPFSGADDREARKVWPGFAALGRRLAERGVAALVCPGPGEDARAEALLPGATRLGGLDLGAYGALMARAQAVVANDTGPGHLAAGVGARLVAVYGPRSVAAWRPLGARVTLLHSPGWASVDEVLAAALG